MPNYMEAYKSSKHGVLEVLDLKKKNMALLGK